MFAPLIRRGYQLLIPLYPAAFRREFGGDMLLLFDSLVADRGILAATSRTSLDLIVTVPRYRLETVISDHALPRCSPPPSQDFWCSVSSARWRVYSGSARP